MNHPAATARYAFFDVDGTVIARDSFRYLLLKLCTQQSWRLVQAPIVLPVFIIAVCVGAVTRDRRWPKSVLLWALTWGRSKRGVIKAIHRAMQHEWQRLWFLETSACLADLRMNQHCRIVFVSASGQLWLRHLLRAMDGRNAKTIIGSRLGFWFLNGVVYKSKNCFGSEKLVRIAERLGTDFEWVAGFSDSAVDIPMLKPCKKRFIICPSARSLKKFQQTFNQEFQLERWQAQIDLASSSPR